MRAMKINEVLTEKEKKFLQKDDDELIREYLVEHMFVGGFQGKIRREVAKHATTNYYG